MGGAAKGKAIIAMNPAEHPLIMRDTVYTLSEGAGEGAITRSVETMAGAVQATYRVSGSNINANSTGSATSTFPTSVASMA